MASLPLPEALEDSQTDLYSLSGLQAFTIATIVLSFLALSLRFWAKYLSAGANFGYVNFTRKLAEQDWAANWSTY